MGCPEDNVIVDFVRAQLDREQRAALERHIDECDACSLVVAEMARIYADDPPADPDPSGPSSRTPNLSDRFGDTLATHGAFSPSALTLGRDKPRSAPALAQGAKLGRYVVIDRIGAGGMGVVYAAYDPELDRKVALKVLRSMPSTGAKHQDQKMRLLREAQAMAKLSHPSVITVHDVGTFEDRVFIAMEFIDGGTLAQWLSRERRPWRDVLQVFVAAGEGLEAAHEGGLVHRDFKPDNVLIGKDGRVLVTDFGLARPARGFTGRFAEVQSIGSQAVLTASLTQTGALVGTPAYMAPEQLAGDGTDALTDQFSFCVALYEGLYGERPFAGKTLGELVASVTGGQIRAPTRDAGVPRWVRRAVLRGLTIDPAGRWPTMRSLLSALRRDPWRSWRRWSTVVIPTTVLAIGLVAMQRVAERESSYCERVDDALGGIWDDARKQKIEAAFVATGRSFASEAFSTVVARLDEYAAQWTDMQRAACEDELRAEQPQAVLSLRMGCLARRLGSLEALADLLASADAATMTGAIDAVRSLPPLSTCGDLDALTDRVEHAGDPATQQEVDAIDRLIVEVHVQLVAGKYDEATATANTIVERSRAIDYRRGDADGLLASALAQERLGDPAEAETSFHRALSASLAAAHPEAMAKASVGLVWMTGRANRSLDEAERWAAHGLAALEQLGGNRRIEAELHQAIAVARMNHGELAAAEQVVQQALSLFPDAAEDEATLAALTTTMGSVLYAQGRVDEAIERFRTGRELVERVYGEKHPNTATALDNLGAALVQVQRYQEALPLHRRALEIREGSLGPRHEHVGGSHQNLSLLELEQGNYDAAMRHAEIAVDVMGEAIGKDSHQLASALSNLATIERKRGDVMAAVETSSRALAIAERALEPDNPKTARLRQGYALALAAAGRREDAIAEMTRVLEVRQHKLGEHPDTATALLELARIEAALARHDDAVEHLERAVEIGDRHELDVGARAEARTLLAASLWEAEARRDRSRALSIARTARDLLALHDDQAEALAALDRWLAEHSAP